jgi:perosamine synthetase
MTLAINGGKPAVTEPLRKYNTIGPVEIFMAAEAMHHGPLSGYLGGVDKGGLYVEELEERLAGILHVKHAVACNSATSGLLMAYAACGVQMTKTVKAPAYTMSATVAAAEFIGGRVSFGDIEDETFGLADYSHGGVIVSTNLFGHPAKNEFRKGPHSFHIEDSAQSIFAKHNGKYLTGDIAVFSFNVHKHIQAGEGGICITNDDDLASRMRSVRNHGELSGDRHPGLNLRMTEVTAAIALAQLRRRTEIMDGRIAFAEQLTEMVKMIPSVRPPVVREGCTHSYYIHASLSDDRDWIVQALNAEGVQMRAGYVTPLYKLPAFKGPSLPVTESVESRIMTFEVCGYDPTPEQLKQMRTAFEKVGEAYYANCRT